MNKVKIITVLFAIIIAIVGTLLLNSNREETDNLSSMSNENQTKIILYFSNITTGELVKEYRYVNISDIKNNMPKTIIDELLKGPENDEFVSMIPSGTEVNSIDIEDSKIIVDFNMEFGKETENELENLHKIYSVVNSLTEITEINEVEIRVEGKMVTKKYRL